MDDVELLKRTLTKIEQQYESDPENFYAHRHRIKSNMPGVCSISIDIIKKMFSTSFTISISDKSSLCSTLRDIKCPRKESKKILKRIKVLQDKYYKANKKKELEQELEFRIKSKNAVLEAVVDPVEEAFFKGDK
jgi:hypothetical protein